MRRPTSNSANPPDSDRLGHYALRGRAGLERTEGLREGVPAGHQPHGAPHARRFRSTPQGIVAGESGLTPARALLNHRQARFIQRLYARPRDGGGVTEATKQLQEAPVVAMATAMAATTTRTAMAIRCCGNGDATAMAMLWQ